MTEVEAAMQMKTPREYTAQVFGSSTLLLHGDTVRACDRAVSAAMHDFVMRLCQADYEGTSNSHLVSEILALLDEEQEDPRQLKLDFS